MHLLCWCLFMCSPLLIGNVQAGENKDDKLDYHSSFNKIVRDLIKNWDSPIVYLKQRGYLSNDFKDTSEIKPNLDALIVRLNELEQQYQMGRLRRTPVSSMSAAQAPATNVETPAKQSNDGQDLRQQQYTPETDHSLTHNLHETIYPTVDELMAQLQLQQQLQHQTPPVKHVQQRAELQPHVKHFDDTLQRIIQKTNVNAQPIPFERSNCQQQGSMHNNYVNTMAMPGKGVQIPVDDPNANVNSNAKPAVDTQFSATQPIEIISQNSKPNVAPVLVQPANSNMVHHLLKLFDREPLPRLYPQSSAAFDDAQQLPPVDYNLDQSMSTSKKAYDFEKAAQYFEMRPHETWQRINKPYYLNWDIKNRQLQSISPLARDAYVNNIINIYANRRRFQEAQQKIQTSNV